MEWFLKADKHLIVVDNLKTAKRTASARLVCLISSCVDSEKHFPHVHNQVPLSVTYLHIVMEQNHSFLFITHVIFKLFHFVSHCKYFEMSSCRFHKISILFAYKKTTEELLVLKYLLHEQLSITFGIMKPKYDFNLTSSQYDETLLKPL